jgi:hypothetical protein
MTEDPIGFEGQDINFYRYVQNNPINLVDPSGLAPNKKGATQPHHVVDMVKTYFNEFANADGKVCFTYWSDRSFAKLLNALSDKHGGNENRYFYTDKYGWVDIRHFFAAAAGASTYGRNKVVVGGFLIEIGQYLSEGKNSYKSGFSPEDLPSNSAGADFGTWFYASGNRRFGSCKCVSQDELVERLEQWLRDAGARNKEDPAAGFGNLPTEDPSSPPGTNRGSNSSSGPVKYPFPPQRPIRPFGINPGGCFVADTPVLTEAGYKLVQEVQVGDKVLSWNEVAKEFELQSVVVLYRTSKTVLYRVMGPDWNVSCSAEHPFLMDDGSWKMVSEMQAGDWVQTRVGRPTRVKSLVELSFDYNVPLFNFEVENTHNYCVTYTGVVVHNKPP